MAHLEEHDRDQYIDTWQAAEAAQFLRDEADYEIALHKAEYEASDEAAYDEYLFGTSI
jgi:hypothetical protein